MPKSTIAAAENGLSKLERSAIVEASLIDISDHLGRASAFAHGMRMAATALADDNGEAIYTIAQEVFDAISAAKEKIDAYRFRERVKLKS